MIDGSLIIHRAELPRARVRRVRRRRRRRHRHPLRKAVALLFVALLVAVAAAVWALLPALQAGLDARSQLVAIQGDADALRQTVSAAVLDDLDRRDTRLMDDLRTVQGTWQQWQGPVLWTSGVVPSVHRQLAQLDPLLRYGLLLGQAEQTLSGPLAPFASLTRSGGSGGLPPAPQLVSRLASARPALRRASDLLRQAMRARRSLSLDGLPSQVTRGVAQLDEYLPQGPPALDVLAALPAALGADGPRDYLVLPQNSLDLRATGGFIGTVALLHADHGRLRLTHAESSYAVDLHHRPNVDPPVPLVVEHSISHWYFRDANWSADFPTSAQVLQAFYTLGAHRHVDGTIAFDSALLPRLLALTGPIPVPGYHETLTPDNAFARINYYSNVAPHPSQAFAVASYNATFARLLDLSHLDTARLLSTVRGGVAARDLLLYANDPAVERAIRRVGADDAINRTTDDYLYVVDTNTNGNKLGGLVQEDRSYQAIIRPDRGILATAVLTYTNVSNSQPLLPGGGGPGFSDFVRVFVPAGSRLQGIYGIDVRPTLKQPDAPWPVYTVHRKTQISFWFHLPPHQTRRILVRYVVPANVDAGARYHLTIQRQPGSPVMPLRIDIDAPGLQLGSPSSPGAAGPLHQSTTLGADIDLTAPLQGGAPRPQHIDYGTEGPVRPGSRPELWVKVPTGSKLVTGH